MNRDTHICARRTWKKVAIHACTEHKREMIYTHIVSIVKPKSFAVLENKNLACFGEILQYLGAVSQTIRSSLFNAKYTSSGANLPESFSETTQCTCQSSSSAHSGNIHQPHIYVHSYGKFITLWYFRKRPSEPDTVLFITDHERLCLCILQFQSHFYGWSWCFITPSAGISMQIATLIFTGCTLDSANL